MARTVFFHVGLPKTGTTYLQTLHVGQPRGAPPPGRAAARRLGPRSTCGPAAWSREDPHLDRRGPEASQRLGPARRGDQRLARHRRGQPRVLRRRERRAGRPGAARPRRAPRCTSWSPPGRRVSLVTARWQEFVKNGSTVPIDDYPVARGDQPARRVGLGHPRPRRRAAPVGRGPAARAGARADAAQARGARATTLWLRFASLLGIDPAACDPSGSAQNESLGVVEVELLRRVNADLTGFGVRPRPRQLDPRLPRAGQAGAARRGAVLALAGAGRRAARAR